MKVAAAVEVFEVVVVVAGRRYGLGLTALRASHGWITKSSVRFGSKAPSTPPLNSETKYQLNVEVVVLCVIMRQSIPN